MKIAILTMEEYESRRFNTVGSSRLRGRWVMNHWPEAEPWKVGRVYDAVIFQKAYFLRYMRAFKGIKILDMCDPDWLEGKEVKEAIDNCDAVTVSSEGLAAFVQQMTDKPVVFIPDRVDLNLHKERKVHRGRAKGVVWYGYNQNHKAIDSTLNSLKRLGLSLTVISDLPYAPGAVYGIDDSWVSANVVNIKFDPEQLNQDIVANGDMVINPQLEGGKWQFKSQNKTYIAWALGMPVVRTSEEMELFMDEQARANEAQARLLEVEDKWNVERSVEQYKKLIEEIHATREGK